MPDFGAPVATQVNTDPLQGLKTISNLMGLQQQKQAIESQGFTIQQQQQNLQKGAAATQVEQQVAAQRKAIAGVDWSKYDDGTGTVSTDKMLSDPALRQAAGDQFLDVIKAGAAVRGQQITNKQAIVGLNDKLRGQFGDMVGALRTDPDVIADNPAGRQKVQDAMASFGEVGGPDAQKVAGIYGQVAIHAPPGQLARGVNAIQLQAMDASRQAAAQAPQFTPTGATLKQTNPQAAGGDLGVSGDLTTSVPPGMSVFQDQAGNSWAFNPQNPGHAIRVGQGGAVSTGGGAQFDVSTPEKLSGVIQGIAAMPDAAMRQQATDQLHQQMQHGGATPPTMTVGQSEAIKGTVDAVNKDWESTLASAKSAGTDIGLLQNIKKFAPGAVTGVETDRRAYISGLASLLGMDAGTLAKTSTDLLAKNTNMLALAGGDTNLARTMAEGANPNTHMTKEAITDAANQVIAQRKLALEKQKLLGPVKTMVDRGLATPDTYNAALAKINSIDPRVLQLPDMGAEEKKKLMGAMSPSEQDAFIKMTRGAHALGMGQP